MKPYLQKYYVTSKGLFRSVVEIAFQSVFHLKKYQKNIFYFLKIIFNISALK
jgi:hypothetical protein